MPKKYRSTDIIEIIVKRKWTLNTNIDYKDTFSRKDLLKIVCSCGKPQTLAVRSLTKYVCPVCKNKYNKGLLTEKIKKICLLCEQPHNMKTQCCSICNKRVKDLETSIAKLLYLKQRYEVKDIFELITQKPLLLGAKVNHKEALELKREVKKEKYRRIEYTKWESEIPLYITRKMKDFPTRKLLTLSGNKSNPIIHYVCIKCGKEQAQSLSNINKGHNCICSKSSGQILVEQFLHEKKIKFKTEFDTFKCINPITKYQLPYDIEILNEKVLIEIQGDQHLSYIPHFHGCEENFEYQQRKDSYKKRWAESKGYKILYIYYNEFHNGEYKKKILNLLYYVE